MPGAKASSVCAIAVGILREVERRAVVEEAAPLRIEPHEVEVILHARAGLGEDAAQHGRDGDDGRPHVEAEAVAGELRGLAAEPFVALEEDDLAPARGEHAGCGEAGESAADDADGFHGCVFLLLALCDECAEKFADRGEATGVHARRGCRR